MKTTIRALAELVLQNIDALEADCTVATPKVPSLQDPYAIGTDFTLEDADVQKASTVIVAAAQQLIQTIQTPQVNLLMTAYSVSSKYFVFLCLDFTVKSPFQTTLTGAIRVATEFHIADILREAGPAVRIILTGFCHGSDKFMKKSGLHVKEISSKCKADPVKIGKSFILHCFSPPRIKTCYRRSNTQASS